MPYNDICDLPEKIKTHLPKKAQLIYMKVFNSAYLKHDEETSCKIAWGAVKRSYYKDEEGSWKKK